LKLDVEHWRQKAQCLDRDEERLRRQDEDLTKLEKENEELRQQNQQLLLTFQQFKQEWEITNAENITLQETLGIYEIDLDRATDEKAQLMGHVNPKQKIHHMVKLKEENKELREQLKKAKQRISTLSASRKGEGLLDALASFSQGLGADQLSVTASVTGIPSQVPRGDAKTPQRSSTPPKRTAPLSARGNRSGSLREDAAEEERRRAIQERAVERVQIDFQHFIALIERAVLAGDSLSEGRCPNPSALLGRLRNVVSGAAKGQPFAPEPRTPRTELRYPETEDEAEADGY
jgi:DNA repair exonuclease SbcCD ATPase subunit